MVVVAAALAVVAGVGSQQGSAQSASARADAAGNIRFENVTHKAGIDFTLVSGTPSKMYWSSRRAAGSPSATLTTTDGWISIW